ncbi:hypothetical protein L1887_40735 [Cichorium endivia]|nr:hypothetical protein L1887_40735 [Cichorium endivia]
MVGIDGPVALPSTSGIRRLWLNLLTRVLGLIVISLEMGRLDGCVNPQCDFCCEDPGKRLILILQCSWRNGFGIRSTRSRRGGSRLNALWKFLDNVNLPNLAKVAFLVHVLLLGLPNYHRAPMVFWILQAFFTLHTWRLYSLHYANCQLNWVRWWVWNCLESLNSLILLMWSFIEFGGRDVFYFARVPGGPLSLVIRGPLRWKSRDTL